MADKQVLLARPHPFIVESMKAYLDSHGFQADAVKKFEDLEGRAGKSFDGIVISASAGTTVHSTYAEVFMAVRKHFPGVPVAFSTLFTSPGTIRSIREALAAAGALVEVTVARSLKDEHGSNHLPARDHILVVSKNDLDNGCPLLSAHFRQIR